MEIITHLITETIEQSLDLNISSSNRANHLIVESNLKLVLLSDNMFSQNYIMKKIV